jgi:Tetracyclin repressor-like, C-terminal domain
MFCRSSRAENRCDPPLLRVEAYRSKLQAIAHAQRAGHLGNALHPVDLLILVLSLASAWFAASPALHSLAAQDPTSPERLAAHRAAVATAVRAITAAAVPQAAAATGAGRT